MNRSYNYIDNILSRSKNVISKNPNELVGRGEGIESRVITPNNNEFLVFTREQLKEIQKEQSKEIALPVINAQIYKIGEIDKAGKPELLKVNEFSIQREVTEKNVSQQEVHDIVCAIVPNDGDIKARIEEKDLTQYIHDANAAHTLEHNGQSGKSHVAAVPNRQNEFLEEENRFIDFKQKEMASAVKTQIDVQLDQYATASVADFKHDECYDDRLLNQESHSLQDVPSLDDYNSLSDDPRDYDRGRDFDD